MSPSDDHIPPVTRPKFLTGSALVAVIFAVCVGVIAILAQSVVRDLQMLEASKSDNIQWTLSQAEVEFLEFQATLRRSSEPVDLEKVREEFDIFYSRIQTLKNSPIYSGVGEDSVYAISLGSAKTFLDETVDLIDSDDSTLLASLEEIENRASELRISIRTLASSGLIQFAEQSDQQRSNVTVALLRLAAVSALLLGALSLLALYSTAISRLTQQRGAALAEANVRMNTILSTSLDGVIVSDTMGRILDFNAAAERIFQRKLKDVKGLPIGEVIVPPHLRKAHDDGVKRMNEKGITRVVGKGRVRLEAMRADGTIFPTELALQSATSGNTQIIIGFLRDISSRVQAENELLNVRDRALAGEKAKADFLTVMSHEIRTPLNGVLGNLTLLDDTALSDDQRRYVDNMQISGQLLMEHVDTVLDIARFESGKVEMIKEPVHLGNLLQGVVDGQGGAANSNRNMIKWAWVGPEIEWVATDAKRLQQILLNLVSNAIKFTHDGVISVEAQADMVNETCATVLFRVSDTGVGIAPEDLDKVFEDFHTTDATFGRQVGGTGLGLGIARRLVESFEGEFGVDSTVGQGSAFWFRIPLDLTEPPLRVTEETKPAEPARKLEILLVEDNKINQMVAQEMLTNLGHRVRLAEDGQKGVEAALAHRYDVIFMDISMPVMDGLDATRQIRAADAPWSETPIYAVSANVLASEQQRFLAAGMNGFLGKPLIRKSVIAALNEVSVVDPTDLTMRAAHGKDGMIHTMAQMRDELGDTVYDLLKDRFLGEGNALAVWLENGPVDMTEMANRCHRSAGSAAVFGALGFRDELIALEQAAKAKDVTRVASLVPNALAEWAKVEAVVQD
ncbi:MAG: ATP-binding protein [Rhodobacteraceae bacterium]|nr:ATP-binding protein [Paracoccaceae bacterium]